MVKAIRNFLFKTLGREWCVFICSMIPIIELRGAIPMGTYFELDPWLNYAISVVGNMLPVPVILLFVRVVLNWMKKIKGLSKIALWVEAKADKNKGKIEKYGYLGVFIFVAVPLPGTGAWTGSLIAALMKMKFWKSLLFVFFGVLTAGIIMLLGSSAVAFIVRLF